MGAGSSLVARNAKSTSFHTIKPSTVRRRVSIAFKRMLRRVRKKSRLELMSSSKGRLSFVSRRFAKHIHEISNNKKASPKSTSLVSGAELNAKIGKAQTSDKKHKNSILDGLMNIPRARSDKIEQLPCSRIDSSIMLVQL